MPENAKNRWLRVSRKTPCPICGRGDWCGVAADGSAASCMRVEQGAVKRLRNDAWLHRLDGRSRPDQATLFEMGQRQAAGREKDPAKIASLNDLYRRQATPRHLDELAAKLGLSSAAPLRAVGVGYSTRHPGWSLPSRDGQGRLVGLQIRRRDGGKQFVTGSRQGLFLPERLKEHTAAAPRSPIVVTEGGSDLLVSMDMARRHAAEQRGRGRGSAGKPPLPSWRSVGRASIAGGEEMVAELIARHHPDGRVRVFVAADADDQGIDGAHRLADRLREGRDGRPPVTQASVLVPEGAKDLRERVAAGLTPRQMADAIGVRLRERGASL